MNYAFAPVKDNECLSNTLENNIRWAEAFILMYSVTDKCSFEEVNQLKFLINYNKRRRKIYKVSYARRSFSSVGDIFRVTAMEIKKMFNYDFLPQMKMIYFGVS